MAPERTVGPESGVIEQHHQYVGRACGGPQRLEWFIGRVLVPCIEHRRPYPRPIRNRQHFPLGTPSHVHTSMPT